jgi:23S rRNA (uracil1939-C5)-methyltransferase
VYGVEIVSEATQNANNLAEQNNIKNLININGDCAKELPKIIEKIKMKATVVLDPPRKGCDRKVLESIIENNINKVIYISCNPISLAKDLKTLINEGGFKINFVEPYDMFPQTANVETLVVLER